MEVNILCPYDSAHGELECQIDTVGDPSVGIGPDGLEFVAGDCVHASAINSDLEEEGMEYVETHWPTFMTEMNKVIEQYQRQESLAEMEEVRDDGAS